MPVFDFLLVVKDVALFRVLQVEELHPLAQVRKAQLVRLQPHGTLRVELLKTLNLGSSLGHFPVRLGRSQLTLGYCLLELRDVALSGPQCRLLVLPFLRPLGALEIQELLHALRDVARGEHVVV